MVKVADLKQGFWGITLDGNKRYSQTVQQSFHVSMAALDCREKGQGDGEGCVSVMLEHAGAEFLLCTLQRGRVYQQALDLLFTEGEDITLFLVGKGSVHLTGYVINDELCEHDDGGEELSSDEFEADHDSDDSASSDDLSQSEDEGKVVKAKTKSNKAAQLTYEDIDEDSSLDDDDDSEDSESELMPPAKRPKQHLGEAVKSEAKVVKGAKGAQAVVEPKSGHTSQKQSAPLEKQEESKQEAIATATAAGSVEKKKKKKKNKKPAASDAAASSSGGTPAAATVPKPSATPAPGAQQKTLAGGVVINDIRVGNGPEAKPGKMAHVYYVGQLSSGKIFDKKTSDKPFNFRLGKGEVIKGWDVGFQGMKVGGKRRIVVPPAMGYGKERAGSIPPNSTLTFDVELKAVN